MNEWEIQRFWDVQCLDWNKWVKCFLMQDHTRWTMLNLWRWHIPFAISWIHSIFFSFEICSFVSNNNLSKLPNQYQYRYQYQSFNCWYESVERMHGSTCWMIWSGIPYRFAFQPIGICPACNKSIETQRFWDVEKSTFLQFDHPLTRFCFPNVDFVTMSTFERFSSIFFTDSSSAVSYPLIQHHFLNETLVIWIITIP
jgi:hypothetical protein